VTATIPKIDVDTLNEMWHNLLPCSQMHLVNNPNMVPIFDHFASVVSGENTHLLVVYTATAAVSLYFAWPLFTGSARIKDGTRPPMATINKLESDGSTTSTPIPKIEFAQNFFSYQAPFYLLNVAREMKQPLFGLPSAPPGLGVYVLSHHRLARTILEDPKSLKPSLAYRLFFNMAGGESFFTAEEQRFKHVRKSTNVAYAPQNVKRMIDIIEDVVSKWSREKLEPICIERSQAIEMDLELPRITMDVYGQVALEYTFSSEEMDTMANALKIIFLQFGITAGKSIWLQLPFTAWMFASHRNGVRASKELQGLCHKILDSHRSREESNTNTVLYLMANDPDYSSEEELIRDMVTGLVGGYDTTSQTLNFILLELARNPSEQNKLWSALKECSSNDEARNCAALKNVIREGLRLHPAAALGSVRETSRDIPVPDSNLIIPAKSWCVVPFFVIQRNGDVYEDPDSFVPDRWTNPSEEALKAFMPFSVGRRGCQGQALANAELTVILAQLCSRYEFWVEDEGEVQFCVTLKAIGTKLRAKRR
jgi:cytochrome P450